MKLRRLASAFLAVVIVGVNVLNGVLPVMADEGDPTIKNPDGPTIIDEDGQQIKLYKTVKSVEGYANKWEVTLRIESPKTEKTSDTVLVIDRSGSMGNNNRLTNAKAAARSLAQQLLPEGNTTNRVAVVSFASTASNSGTGTDFTDSYDTVSTAIGRMSSNGGTFTQSAIHMAAEMLRNSTADIKTMILLSDGEPTYSVPFTTSARDDDSNFVAYDGALESSSEVEQSVFNYTSSGRVGNGSNLRYCIDTDWWGNCVKYYNHGNSAIAEAGYFKESGNGALYTIALEAGSVGTPILNAIASPDKHYTATPSELTTIFKEIGGNILSLIQEASVEDTMGHGVMVSGTNDTSIEWEPVFELQGDVFVAETSYEVEMDESVFDQASDGGYYALNESAVLTYNDGKTGEFPIPKAKPFAVHVEKQLVQRMADGSEESLADGQIFKFNISGVDKDFYVESGDENIVKVTVPIELGTQYTITEDMSWTGENALHDTNNYLVEYDNNVFTVNKDHGDQIDVVIKNIYESVGVDASKEWNDDEDRDGKRNSYNDLYVAVKDGANYVKIANISTAKGQENQEFEFNDLPKNRDGKEIKYTIVEARGCNETTSGITCQSEFSGDDIYSVENEGGAIINTHEPETVKLTIKKKWDVSAGTLPTATPGFVTVEVSNDKNDTVETVTLRGEAYNEWTGEFEGYKYDNGQTINYTVTEKTIDENALDTSKNTLYVYEGDVLEGKWVASHSGTEVTNTWTPATTVYSGVGKFYIEKVDQDGEAISGVTFAVGNDEYTTGNDGKVEIVFSEATEKPDDSYTIRVTETDAPDYYDLISGTEVLVVSTGLDLAVDTEELTNTYTKTFEFGVQTAVSGYVWQENNLTLTATDQALAKELIIEKTFEGITPEAFEENSEIEFVITGPEGFSEMTVGNGDEECKISGSELVCVISGTNVLLPIGEYTITENNAAISNFDYVSDPIDGKVTQSVELGETARFEFKNTYTPVKTASYAVKKIWEDDDDRDGLRPDDLKVTLFADGKAYGEPVILTGEEWSYEWIELPLVNENAEVIDYSVEEEDVSGYESDNGKLVNGVFVFTNTHEPETKNIKIKKVWDVANGNLPSTAPTFIMVELSKDKDDEKKQIRLDGDGYGEWESDEISVFVYANQGETVTYEVKELSIDGEGLSGDNADTLYIYNGEVLEGKWVAEDNGLSVKNTWTPATSEYEFEGEDKFEILKLDEEGDVMSGVVFAINDETETTNDDGVIEIEVPISEDEAEEEFKYEISEKESPYGYDEVEGSATITVTCTSDLKGVDEDNLVNKYTKTCEYKKTGDDGFVWDEEAKRVIVTNLRSLAGSLTIKKIFLGVSAAELNDLTFTITGPEDFGEDGEIEIMFSDDCTISGDTAICEIDVKVPTGEYTVKENNAEIGGYELTVEGDGEIREIEKDDDVEFVISNTYEKIPPTSCEDGGECGGGEEVPIKPDTGVFTGGNNGGATINNSMIYSVKVVAIIALISTSLIAVNIREVEKYKTKR